MNSSQDLIKNHIKEKPMNRNFLFSSLLQFVAENYWKFFLSFEKGPLLA